MDEQRKATGSIWLVVQSCEVVDAPRSPFLGWTSGRGLQGQGGRGVSRLKIHLCCEKEAQIAAWGTLHTATKKGREVGKVGTHLSEVRHIPVWGSGARPLHTSDVPCRASSVQQRAVTLGSSLLG